MARETDAPMDITMAKIDDAKLFVLHQTLHCTLADSAKRT